MTAGLPDLTVADQMGTIALSRGDRDRSTDIAKNGANMLREGYATLSSLVDEDRRNIQQDKDWNHRVFLQSNWEKSASLAGRAMAQTRYARDTLP